MTRQVKGHSFVEPRGSTSLFQLFGVDESFKWVVTALVIFQTWMCWLLQGDLSP